MREDKFNILTIIEVEFDYVIRDPRYSQWFINNLRCFQATFRALVSTLRVYMSDYKFRKSAHSFAKKVASWCIYIVRAFSDGTLIDIERPKVYDGFFNRHGDPRLAS
ncbi:hypothetical protein SDRG_00317 [Saprolegnia diclina VS20]|uniref:Uncharacterized protein n=1 Tax=Saprolegnia diclina (strain VS20) TaxID=1156394 RepID=T0SB33_SAPDV|nr:hypothetical protein SDRG_00317 [Saprolegnia diclina VS20]EQC42588.1 hypothetical protein SDRG_00317 [Saprolegnia diclina VS20]|eukprot:XP_008604011.1 hypothetical protein SDRG_00317 [Saprolegnia diclina VS20]